jgi:hypothetical protein
MKDVERKLHALSDATGYLSDPHAFVKLISHPLQILDHSGPSTQFFSVVIERDPGISVNSILEKLAMEISRGIEHELMWMPVGIKDKIKITATPDRNCLEVIVTFRLIGAA